MLQGKMHKGVPGSDGEQQRTTTLLYSGLLTINRFIRLSPQKAPARLESTQRSKVHFFPVYISNFDINQRHLNLNSAEKLYLSCE